MLSDLSRAYEVGRAAEVGVINSWDSSSRRWQVGFETFDGHLDVAAEHLQVWAAARPVLRSVRTVLLARSPRMTMLGPPTEVLQDIPELRVRVGFGSSSQTILNKGSEVSVRLESV